MHILFHLLLLIPIISTTPIPITDRQLAVLEYMSIGATNETDIIAYSMKMLEEHSKEQRFGLTGDDYLRVCAGNLTIYKCKKKFCARPWILLYLS